MSNTDIHNNITPSVAIEPQALSGTTDVVGEIIDTKGYSACEFVLVTDAIAVGSLVAQLLIEECDAAAMGDAATVADEFLIGTEAATAIVETDDKVAKRVGLRITKRYARATLTVTTNAGTDVVAGVCLLGGNRYLPEA
jgi:hypothetical protein